MRAQESESKKGIDSSFDTLMEKLACKIQGEDQTVGHYAAEIEATRFNILHQYPDHMDEDSVVDVKRKIFYNGLRRVYRESFVHMYEDKKSFEEMRDAVLIVEKALQKLPTKKGSEECNSSKKKESRRGPTVRAEQIRGWTRTGLEPEVVVYVNNQPQDAILDLGSDVSLINQEITDDLVLTVNPFICDVPQAASLRGRGELCVAVSNVIGWVELELGIFGIGCIPTRLFVARHLVNKGVQVVWGSQIIKKIFAQANVRMIDCSQKPWRLIYEGCIKRKWYTGDLSDSDSDHSFEVVSRHITSWTDKTLEKVRSSTPTWEEEVKQAEKRIAASSSTALKGIPGPLKEPDGQEDSTSTAQVGLPLPIGAEESSSLDGGKTSVFANLTKE